MKQQSLRHYGIVTVTFIVALMLVVLPLPSWVVWSRPAWVLLLLFYWMLKKEGEPHLFFPWFLGLIVDLLTGTLLGMHALAYVATSFLFIKMRGCFRCFSLQRQFIAVFLLVLLAQALLAWMQHHFMQIQVPWSYWNSVWVSALLWFWLVLLRFK